jgi:hypothetical protein
VAEYLDSHPEASGCYHACRIVSTLAGGGSMSLLRPDPFPTGPITIDDMFRENPIQTYSVMTYRRGLVPQFPEWHRSFACGDWALHMLHAEHGPVGFVPYEMAVYRRHAGAIMVSMPTERSWNEYFDLMQHMDRRLQGTHASQIREARHHFVKRIATHYDYLKVIERRYHAAGLGLVAAAYRRIRGFAAACRKALGLPGRSASKPATSPGGGRDSGGPTVGR